MGDRFISSSFLLRITNSNFDYVGYIIAVSLHRASVSNGYGTRPFQCQKKGILGLLSVHVKSQCLSHVEFFGWLPSDILLNCDEPLSCPQLQINLRA